jgi:threonine dehydrogenase-like Zn-dependent dehydrogenase
VKAIAIVPGTPGARLIDVAEPSIAQPHQVKLKVLNVGICGTDREQAAGGRALAPENESWLVVGHEMLGQVVETGSAVERVRNGDYALFTVRRPCSRCIPCSLARPDICRTGEYRERGIWGLPGFQTEYVVDDEQWLIPVPEHLKEIAVLAEPASIAEKAIDEAVRVQRARLPAGQANPNWLEGRRCLVAGLGPVGLLATLILRLRDAEVYGYDIVDADNPRPRWLERIGGRYVDGRQIPAGQIDQRVGMMDFIFEATGSARLIFNLLDAMAPDGVYAVTGIPGGDRAIEIPGPALAREVVLDNRLMLGSVNAARNHFQMAIQDLSLARLSWGDHVDGLITHRYPAQEFAQVLGKKPEEEIKAVVRWTSQKPASDRPSHGT